MLDEEYSSAVLCFSGLRRKTFLQRCPSAVVSRTKISMSSATIVTEWKKIYKYIGSLTIKATKVKEIFVIGLTNIPSCLTLKRFIYCFFFLLWQIITYNILTLHQKVWNRNCKESYSVLICFNIFFCEINLNRNNMKKPKHSYFQDDGRSLSCGNTKKWIYTQKYHSIKR